MNSDDLKRIRDWFRSRPPQSATEAIQQQEFQQKYYEQMQKLQYYKGFQQAEFDKQATLQKLYGYGMNDKTDVFRKMMEEREARMTCRLCGGSFTDAWDEPRGDSTVACSKCVKRLVTAAVSEMIKVNKVCNGCGLHYTRCLCDKSKGIKKLKQ